MGLLEQLTALMVNEERPLFAIDYCNDLMNEANHLSEKLHKASISSIFTIPPVLFRNHHTDIANI